MSLCCSYSLLPLHLSTGYILCLNRKRVSVVEGGSPMRSDTERARVAWVTSPSWRARVDFTVVTPASAHCAAALFFGGVARKHVVAEVGIVQVVVALLHLLTM